MGHFNLRLRIGFVSSRAKSSHVLWHWNRMQVPYLCSCIFHLCIKRTSKTQVKIAAGSINSENRLGSWHTGTTQTLTRSSARLISMRADLSDCLSIRLFAKALSAGSVCCLFVVGTDLRVTCWRSQSTCCSLARLFDLANLQLEHTQNTTTTTTATIIMQSDTQPHCQCNKTMPKMEP